jgi:hypothetical protein
MSDLSRRERETMYWLLGMLQERHDIENIYGDENRALPFELTYAAKETANKYRDRTETSLELLHHFHFVFECEWDIRFKKYVELKKNDKWQ